MLRLYRTYGTALDRFSGTGASSGNNGDARRSHSGNSGSTTCQAQIDINYSQRTVDDTGNIVRALGISGRGGE